MKSVELNLNKRLLIVEPPDGYSLVHFRNGQSKLGFVNLNIANPYDDVIDLEVDGKIDLICEGSELTDNILRTLIKNEISEFLVSWNWDYVSKEPLNDDFFPPMQSFISAIESKGYHWGENPYEKELDSCNAYTDMFTIAKRARKYEEAESRTFYPDKCIIFQIL